MDSNLIEPINRRTFMKGMGIMAGALALPQFLAGPQNTEAHALTGGGVRMVRFAHLTDLHFTTRKQNRYPTSHYHIRQAVEDLNHQDLDFIMFTGDMFHFPEDIDGEMPALADALKGLRHPYYVAIGNHDAEGDGVIKRKTMLRNHLGDAGLSMGENYYTFSPLPGLRFIVLDSTDIDGDSYHAWTGQLSDRQMRWLKETLVKHRDESIVVALHHPPVTPYPFMEKLKFEAAPKQHLEELLSQFPNVQLMLAGHYHFGGRNRFANAELLLGPSLVEHPHPYRVIEIQQTEKGKGLVAYKWETLNLHGSDDHACAFGTAALRSAGLLRLSYNHTGYVPMTLAN